MLVAAVVSATCCIIVVFFACSFFKTPSLGVLDLAVFEPPADHRISKSNYMDFLVSTNFFSQESLNFQEKILYLSGLGDATPLPEGFTSSSSTFSYEETLQITCKTMFATCATLFSKTSIDPQSIQYVIVTSSFFSATPSLAHRIIDHFSLSAEVPIALVGMGCAESLIAVDLLNRITSSCPGRCLVVSIQPFTSSFYKGANRSMLIPNCLFRFGCSAVLLSNLPRDRALFKFTLNHIHRSVEPVGSVHALEYKQDKEGHVGFFLSPDLLEHYLKVIRKNLMFLAPKVFSTSVIISYLFDFLKFLINPSFKLPPSWPSFSKGADHFCIHAGGRGVLDALEQSLDLSDSQRESGRQVLENYGNMSGCCVWYSLLWLMDNNKILPRETVWLLGFGSGMECVSCVLKKQGVRSLLYILR
ncbi:hypothetical protein GEMRC1_003014 [Eukaryota sp. GEM-RC1]